jgi:hypothetical protein
MCRTTIRDLAVTVGIVLGVGCAKQTPPPQTVEPQETEGVAQETEAVAQETEAVAEVEPVQEPRVVQPARPVEPTGPLTCDSTYGMDVEPRGGCITDDIGCGETVRGHTVGGGGNRFDTKFYQSKFCLVSSETYQGEERIYRFSMPAATLATAELHSPCEDLDLFVMQWAPQQCPAPGSSVGACDVTTRPGGGSVDMVSINNPRHFLLVIDGKGGVEAPFELTLSCQERK